MNPFDQAWLLLKMGRRNKNNRRGQQVSRQRRFNRPMQIPPHVMQSLGDDTKMRLETMKQTDPEAYQKYLIELSMAQPSVNPSPNDENTNA